jgi:hypothetical protein
MIKRGPNEPDPGQFLPPQLVNLLCVWFLEDEVPVRDKRSISLRIGRESGGRGSSLLYDPHCAEQLLQNLRSLIGILHRLRSDLDRLLHRPSLDRDDEQEKGDTG